MIEKNSLQHKPVLLAEVLANLDLDRKGFFVDGTFGRGGHSKEILKRLSGDSLLLVLDKDLAALEEAKKISDKRLIVRHAAFSELKKITSELGWMGKVEGILLDLGVSSPQLDDSSRGFSFLQDGPLDMRMDQSRKLTAESWLEKISEGELADVLWRYGEERFSRRIAKAIVEERAKEPIKTTGRLAEIVKKANPHWEKHKHPATRAFQALRIAVNDELLELKLVLEQSLDVLKVGGRLLVITFHSLEDRLVKDFIKKNSGICSLPKEIPIRKSECETARIKSIGVIRGSFAEVEENPRARSATLRVMEKIA
ncbi:MAG: 16S rRNA (cytosine(1402)-N(4))-methyltransferase RsmH [Gammaproteobacteria bacterium]